MAAAVATPSASGVLALLDDTDNELVSYALHQLAQLVDVFWADIADSASRLEILYEDASFADRQLAALVAARLYYHLGDLDDALTFALGAGDLFDVTADDQFVQTIISASIDKYVAQRADAASSIDPRLTAIVERMFERCISDREYRQAIGMALESRRLDVLERVLDGAKEPELFAYVLDAVMTVSITIELRDQVLRLLVKLFNDVKRPDYFAMARCYAYLKDPEATAVLLRDLVGSAQALIAYQIAFDLADSTTQEFLGKVRSALEGSEQTRTWASEAETAAGAMDTDDRPAPSASAHGHLTRVLRILTGEETIQLYLEFLHRNNHADLLILKNTKDALAANVSVYHSAITFANAFANAGTASDKFIRDNLDWLGKAANWSKFSATAALGVIHKGNITQGMSILQPYLPNNGNSSSPYSEGGSLYALGLIHAKHGAGVLEYLRKALKDTTDEVIQHGAALGLGMAGMATGSEEVYDELRTVLFNDSAVAGEAAGYAMGLVMLGTGSQKALDEMLQYAHETQHEKIIRGLAVGIAFLMYGRQEKADAVIELLATDKDPILRYGGIHVVALAYAGTGNNGAIKRLLHVAVSDVNDDVRRAAVIALGFILFRTPTQVPRIVQLLSESYNPNVRFGATLALGISCAGTGLDDAIELLEPMCKDPVDFVRQGACIALAMVLLQQNDTLNPKAAAARATFAKMIGDKHEDAMAKMGAALAQGLIDAGGRNATISLQSRGGGTNMPAVVGMALFTQFWYWFPLAHAASLAFGPTALIGVDADLRMPKFELTSAVRPSLFAYQPATKPPEKEKVEKVETAVLSMTAKSEARQKAKDQAKDGGGSGGDAAMATDETSAGTKEGGEEEKEKDKAAAAKKAPEPTSETLPNLSRVVPAQLPYITIPASCRFQPVRPITDGPAPASSSSEPLTASRVRAQTAQSTATSRAVGGILVLIDNGGDGPVEYIELEANADHIAEEAAAAAAAQAQPAGGAAAAPAGGNGGGNLGLSATDPIADPPAPFEYPFED